MAATTTTAMSTLSPKKLRVKRSSTTKMPENNNNKPLATTLDFGSIMSLPISNEENQKLEQQVNDQKFKLDKCQRDIANLDKSIHTMWQHLQNIKGDVEQNQSLLRAKDSAVETESRMLQIIKLEVSKLQTESKTKENIAKENLEKQARNQRILESKKKELDKIIADSGQSREEFDEHLSKVLRADDTNITIQKDMIVEEHISTEMSVKLEKFNDLCAKKRKELDTIQTELRAVQLNLDKANTDIQKEQFERQRLIEQCESTMGIWTKKDANFQTLQNNLTEYRSESEVLQKSLKEKTDEVKSMHMTSKDLIRKITYTNELLSKLRNELAKIENNKQQLQDEIFGESAMVSNANSKQKMFALQVAQLKTDVDKKEKSLQVMKQKKEDGQKSVEDVKNQHESNEDKAKRLTSEVKSEQSKKQSLEKQKQSLQDLIAKKKDQISNCRKEEKKVQKDIDALKATARNLVSKFRQLDKQNNKHQQSIDTREAEIKRLEQELEFAAGSEVRTVDIETSTSTVALKKKLDRLKLSHVENDAALQTWESTLKKTESDLDKLKKEVSKLDQYKKIKEHTLIVLQAETETLERASKKLIEEKQEWLVKSNLLNVEIKRLESTFNAKSVEVLSVGQEKESLSLALKSHQQEIRLKKDQLQTEYCQLEEERKKMSLQFKELLNRMEQMKNRYDIYVISLRPPDNTTQDAGKHFVTKFEKEKEELTVLSDELNGKIKKSEKEVQALENTLKLITERNHSFRQGIVQADKNCPDYQEKFELETQYRALGDKYAEIMKEIKASQAKLQEMESDFDEISKQQSNLTSQIHLEHLSVEKLKQEVYEQEQKLERWDHQTAKAVEDFRKTKSAGKNRNALQSVEMDIDIQQMKMLTTSACKVIALLLNRNPETSELIIEEFKQNNLPLDFSMDSSTTTTATKRSDTDSAISSQRSMTSAQSSTLLALRKVNIDAASLPRIETKPSSAHKSVEKKTNSTLPHLNRK